LRLKVGEIDPGRRRMKVSLSNSNVNGRRRNEKQEE